MVGSRWTSFGVRVPRTLDHLPADPAYYSLLHRTVRVSAVSMVSTVMIGDMVGLSVSVRT